MTAFLNFVRPRPRTGVISAVAAPVILRRRTGTNYLAWLEIRLFLGAAK